MKLTRRRARVRALALPVAASLAWALLGTPVATAQPRPDGLRVGRSTLVSLSTPATGCALPEEYDNPQAAVDPNDPKRLVVTYSVANGDARVASTSSDGGSTWATSVLPRLTACTGNPDGGTALDPFLSIGADSRVYSSASWVNFDPGSTVRTGHDSGRGYVSAAARPGDGFTAPVDLDPLVAAQRPVVLADPHHPSMVTAFYQHGTNLAAPPVGDGSVCCDQALPLAGDPLYVRTSTDGGATFGQPAIVAVPLPGHAHVTIGLQRSGSVLVAVRADVDLSQVASAQVTHQPIAQQLVAHRSEDGGRTWTAGVAVGTFELGSSFAIPDLSAGPDGDLFLTWPQSGTPGHILVAHSADAGATWATTVAATTAGEVLEPAVAARGHGRAAIAFYEHTGDSVVERVVSTQDATSWSAPVAFSRAFSMADLLYAGPDGGYDGAPVGPYQDLVTVAGGYAAAFTTEVAGHEQIAFTRLLDD